MLICTFVFRIYFKFPLLICTMLKFCIDNVNLEHLKEIFFLESLDA